MYQSIGQLVAMAIVQGEIHINLMGKHVYQYIAGYPLRSLNVSVQDIPDEVAERKCVEASDCHNCKLFETLSVAEC